MTRTNTKVLHSLIAAKAHGIRSFLRRRLPAQQVPDLAQEVFARLLQAGEARELVNPEAYLFTVAANLVREHATKERTQAVRQIALSDPIVAEALIAEPDAESELSNEALGRLRQALRELPSVAVTAIHMAYAEERSYQEIGRALGLSKPAVGRMVKKALGHCCRKVTGGTVERGRRSDK